MQLNNSEKLLVCNSVIEYLIGETLDTVNYMFNDIAYQQKQIVLHPTDICRFIYQNKEYRSPRDTTQQYVKPFPLHRSLHNKMPNYLALFEPFELEAARIRSVTLAAVQTAGSYKDLIQLLPEQCVNGINWTTEAVSKPATLVQEDINKFKQKYQSYLDTIKVNLFSRFLAGE